MDSHEAAPLESATAVAAATLVVDAVTAQAVLALRDRSISSILLRGRALAHRLYGLEESRPYGDADLMVPSVAFEPAERVLHENGFREASFEVAAGSERPGHAHTWISPVTGIAVDLHVTLIGVGAPPERVWEALADEAEPLDVAGVQVEIPSIRAAALIVALHARQHAALPDAPLEDLLRAIRHIPESAWAAAAELAHDLAALPAFAAGLQMAAGGEELVKALELQPRRVRRSERGRALRGGQAFHIAQGFDWMAHERGLRAKALYLCRKGFPAPSRMRALYPLARRGPGGLTASYAWRSAVLLAHTPGALLLRHRRRRARV